mgnify:CR=1 FL=1|jgi:hypothetical protein
MRSENFSQYSRMIKNGKLNPDEDVDWEFDIHPEKIINNEND